MPNISFIEKYTVIQKLGPHSHEYWEIIYIIDGTGHFKFQNSPAVKYKRMPGPIPRIPFAAICRVKATHSFHVQLRLF